MKIALDNFGIQNERYNDEIRICEILPLDEGTQQDFIDALQRILDKFIQFLEDKEKKTPNWLTTLV